MMAPTGVTQLQHTLHLKHGMLCTGGEDVVRKGLCPATTIPPLLPERPGKHLFPVFHQTGGIPHGLHSLW